jgi:hypothetical protein
VGYGVVYLVAQIGIALLMAWPFFGSAAMLRLVRLANESRAANDAAGADPPPDGGGLQLAAYRGGLFCLGLTVLAALAGLAWLTTPVQLAVEAVLLVALLLSRNLPVELAFAMPMRVQHLGYRVHAAYLLGRLERVPIATDQPERYPLLDAARRAVRAVPGSLQRLAQFRWHERRLIAKASDNPHVREPLVQVRTLITTINQRHATLLELLRKIEGQLEALAVGADVQTEQLAEECDRLARQIEAIAIATGTAAALTGPTPAVAVAVESTAEAAPPDTPPITDAPPQAESLQRDN